MNKINIQEIEEYNESIFMVAYCGDYERLDVKGFRVYLVDLGDPYFKYSMLVFAPNGNQVVYAHDFELHHNNKTREELRELYIKKANACLFTEEELAAPLKSYHDFEARRRFITELLPFCAKNGYFSVFRICTTEEEEAMYEAEKEEYPVCCPPAYCYFKQEDEAFSSHICALFIRLTHQEKDSANNYEYQYNAFYYELGNHEYHINSYQGDWDTLSAFGNIEWHGQGAEAREKYFAELGFTDVQRKAFEDARRQFLHDAMENDWY